MITKWTSEDIESILVQLNSQNLPFTKYVIASEEGKLCLLGKGASANVYRAKTRDKGKLGYAIKVIGFGDKHVESKSFGDLVYVQKTLGKFHNNVVKIFDSVELRVWIEGENTVAKAEIISPYEAENMAEGKYLHLQFILMEEIAPILIDNHFGKPSLMPHKLAIFDEKEIIKLAYDIGLALFYAHTKKLIHRDVKLENIFYTPKDDQYKLGDFGIACTTDDGLASTVAFTKGYGAPEVVGTLEDKYDYTADIYSFGMVLYVLLNELRFPSSNNYHPNFMQYARGFKADFPTTGSDELCNIVLKMISFDPDDRYQTMEEVLNEFEKLKYGRRLKYQREHRSTSLVLGTSLAMLGAGMLLTQLIMKVSLLGEFTEYRWIAFFLISLSMFLLLYHGVLEERDEEVVKLYLGKNLYWFMVALMYGLLVLIKYTVMMPGYAEIRSFEKIFGQAMVDKFMSVNPDYIGFAGVSFCLFWIVREWMLRFIERQIEKRKMY